MTQLFKHYRNCRDLAEIRQINLPLFAKGLNAKSTSKQTVGSIKKAVICGGVSVEPGDLILADSDGIVVLNKEEAIKTINKAELIQEKETKAMQLIREGKRFDEICNVKEHIAKRENNEDSILSLNI